jgi:hypothetical protein
MTKEEAEASVLTPQDPEIVVHSEVAVEVANAPPQTLVEDVIEDSAASEQQRECHCVCCNYVDAWHA